MSRVDQSTVATKTHWYEATSGPDGLTVHADNTSSQSYVAKRRERSDIVKSAPDSKGFRMPTPYGATIIEESPWIGYVTQSQKMTPDGSTIRTTNGQGNLQGAAMAFSYKAKPIHYPSTGYNSFPDGLEARAMNRALLRIKDQEVNYALALAEGRKTVGTVTAAATALYKAYKAARKGDMRGAQRALSVSPNMRNRRKARGRDEAGGRWLELQYGWMPLVSDVYGAVKDLDKGFLREPRYSATYTTRETESYVHEARNGYVYSERTDVKIDHICKVRLDYTLDGVDLSLITRNGFTNPAEIAWELVPYSFVADWFVPVGEYLQTLDAALFSTFRSGTVSKVTEVRCSGSLKEYGGGEYGRRARAESHSLRKYFSRSVITNPSGGLYFTNPFNATRALNAIALLNSAFKNTRR